MHERVHHRPEKAHARFYGAHPWPERAHSRFNGAHPRPERGALLKQSGRKTISFHFLDVPFPPGNPSRPYIAPSPSSSCTGALDLRNLVCLLKITFCMTGFDQSDATASENVRSFEFLGNFKNNPSQYSMIQHRPEAALLGALRIRRLRFKAVLGFFSRIWGSKWRVVPKMALCDKCGALRQMWRVTIRHISEHNSTKFGPNRTIYAKVMAI